MVRTLRYLGAVAGASVAAATAPALCKEHRSSGMEKLRIQQQRESPHAPDVSSLLANPPRRVGLLKAAQWQARNFITSLELRLRLLELEKTAGKVGPDSAEERFNKRRRKRVVVAGGGWASAAFVKQLDPRQFEVVWVSPQPHFSYTPLLPSVCGGALPVSACTAKLRDLLSIGGDATARGTYQQALIDAVDLQNKRVTCKPVGPPSDPLGGGGAPSWEEPYDYLVLAVGSEVNTFNIRGVKENALFLRTAEDAQRIRARLGACLEAAANPSTSEEARQRLLTFVVVGAGPSGIEASAEIRDYLNSEGKRLYPQLSKDFRVVVLEMGAAPLPMYNEQVQEAVKRIFKESGIELRLQTQVIQVSPGSVSVKRSTPPVAAAASKAAAAAPPQAAGTSAASAAAGHKAEASVKEGAGLTPGSQVAVESIPTDFVLWASGMRPTTLATTVAKGLAAQSRPQRLLVDPSFRVLGTDGLFALGDCCTIAPPLLADHAQQLYELAVEDRYPASAGNVGRVPVTMLIGLHQSTDWLLAHGERLSTVFPQLHPKRNKLHELPPQNGLSLEQFTQLLKDIDKRYMSPAPTAQNARQEGRFLAILFNSYLGPSKGAPLSEASAASPAEGPSEAPAAASSTSPALPAFVETWRGSLCFLGNGNVALQLPVGTFIGGFPFTLLWRLVYMQLQPSARASWRCCEGWLQSALFGRDIVCVIPPPPKGSNNSPE